MRTYRCEDVTLSDRGIDSKGWLCNPQEKGKKPAILVLGPKMPRITWYYYNMPHDWQTMVLSF